MTGSITALYAGVLALIVVALGINVTVHRVKLEIPLGDRGNAQMSRMILLHVNAAECIPLAVLLMLVFELNGGMHIAPHIAGVALVVARLLQTWGMWSTEIPGFGRRVGQTITWLAVAALASLNIWQIA